MPDKLDYKKEYKDLYQPGKKPVLIEVPPIPMFLTDGAGDPNGPDYQSAMNALYSLTFTLKMSKMGPWQPQGYFDYVLPPLEGFWARADGDPDLMGAPKDTWLWTSGLRAPDYCTGEVFAWAVEEVRKKKPEVDVGRVRLETVAEGLCVQCLHVGPYEAERGTIQAMHELARGQGLRPSTDPKRRHHEIYLGDPRKTAPEKWRTVLRTPLERG